MNESFLIPQHLPFFQYLWRRMNEFMWKLPSREASCCLCIFCFLQMIWIEASTRHNITFAVCTTYTNTDCEWKKWQRKVIYSWNFLRVRVTDDELTFSSSSFLFFSLAQVRTLLSITHYLFPALIFICRYVYKYFFGCSRWLNNIIGVSKKSLVIKTIVELFICDLFFCTEYKVSIMIMITRIFCLIITWFFFCSYLCNKQYKIDVTCFYTCFCFLHTPKNITAATNSFLLY